MAAGGLGLGSGCARAPKGFDSPEPAARLDAITRAAERRDRASIPDLITLLGSDDPVVRLASIRTLELLTGQTLGYDYAASPAERKDMVDDWVRWYRENHPGRPDPQPGPGTADRGVSAS